MRGSYREVGEKGLRDPPDVQQHRHAQSTAHCVVVRPLPDNPGEVVHLGEQDITARYDHMTVRSECRQQEDTVRPNCRHKIHAMQDPWDIIVS